MNISKKIFICKNIQETNKLAESFAQIAKRGDVFALYGTLGAGKSTFSRSFIQSITQEKDVPSPTFTLLQTYNADKFDIFHYDFYRLEKPEDAYELGVEESFFYGVNLIEWPEKIQNLLPKDIWKINITINNDIRFFTIEVFNDEKFNRLQSIKHE